MTARELIAGQRRAGNTQRYAVNRHESIIGIWDESLNGWIPVLWELIGGLGWTQCGHNFAIDGKPLQHTWQEVP
jgi:hypothetical protein